MKQQNYKNHTRLLFLYHGILLLLVLAVLLGSLVNLFKSIGNEQKIYSASLITVIAVILCFIYLYMRSFALKAQDRAIRAEENFRHYLLTGKPLDTRLHIRQIVALRFAPDEELVSLAAKAATENLGGSEIKKQIKNWRGDYYRV